MNGDHRLISVESDQTIDHYRARCMCGFKTRWCADRGVAVRVVGDHVDECVAEMTEDRAKALLHECALGLHEDFVGPDGGCTYDGCRDAYFFEAELKQERTYASWMSNEAKRAKLR